MVIGTGVGTGVGAAVITLSSTTSPTFLKASTSVV